MFFVGNEIQEHQTVFHRQSLAQRAFHFRFLGDADTDVPVRFGQFHEIRQRIEIRFRFTVAVIQLLPLAHHTQITIIQTDDFHWQLILKAGAQFLNIHLHRTFARDTANIFARIGKICAHRIRQADTHRAQTARIEPLARPLERIILRGKHLVLPHIGRDNCIVVGQFRQFLDDVLRQNQLVIFGFGQLQAVFAAPIFNVFPPFRQLLGIKR